MAEVLGPGPPAPPGFKGVVGFVVSEPASFDSVVSTGSDCGPTATSGSAFLALPFCIAAKVPIPINIEMAMTRASNERLTANFRLAMDSVSALPAHRAPGARTIHTELGE